MVQNWLDEHASSADGPATLQVLPQKWACPGAQYGLTHAPELPCRFLNCAIQHLHDPRANLALACRYSCGRLASDGYAPSATALQLMWDRTQQLALSFDSQGIANMLW